MEDDSDQYEETCLADEPTDFEMDQVENFGGDVSDADIN